MTLSISRKYHTFQEEDWNNYIPAFDTNKNKLTVIETSASTSLITDLKSIAQHVNNLVKPLYREVNTFYRCFKNIERINDLIQKSLDKEKTSLIDLKPFCLALRPSISELQKSLWAVHVSDYLWPDAIIKPFSKQLSTQERSQGISLTVHFTLGEMVRPHNRIHTWKFRRIAILTPLSEIWNQLVSIYSYDTFIHGQWKISPKAILIVPENLTVPSLYSEQGIKIISYNSDKISLRKLIKNQIKEHKGIYLRMVRNLLFPGSPAYLFDDKKININNIEFFESLFQINKDLSFGPDVLSLNNKTGYCFGIIRQVSSKIKKLVRKDISDSSIEELYLYFEFVYSKIKEKLSLFEQEQIDNFLKDFKFCLNIKSKNIKYAATDLLK